MSRSPAIVLFEFGPTGLPEHESYSPFCMKVHRALRYAGLRYDTRAVDPRQVRTINPKGQLPVLEVDGTTIADSTPILRRIEALSPLAAKSTPEARLWEEAADGAFYGYLVASRWADDANWERTRETYFAGLPRPIRKLVAGRIRARVVASLVARDIWRGGPRECWSRLDDLLDDLDARAPAHGFFLGDALSVADLAIFPQIHGFRTSLTPEQKARVERRRNLVAYLDRVHAATAEVRAVPITELAA